MLFIKGLFMSLQVLVVDDSEADQFLCQYALEHYDPSMTILKAYDGKEALAVIDEKTVKPDYIFLDINMPRMNGFEFLEAYQHRPDSESTVIVMLTSSIQDDDYQRCMSYSQVKMFLSKPLSIDRLSDCFHWYCGTLVVYCQQPDAKTKFILRR